jgi:hypothetical protein
MNELPACPECHFWPMSVKHLEKWSMTPLTFRCGRCGLEPRPGPRKLDVRGAQKIALTYPDDPIRLQSDRQILISEYHS